MGIKKRVMVELLSTEHVDFPIMKDGKVLIDDELLKIIISESNMRLERTWEKINRLNRLI
jgi:tRNA(Phe) wybutosine-synthesizing methylase Tyw3